MDQSAWLLPLQQDIMAAVGPFELVHVMDEVQPYPLPYTPPHCQQVFFWQERLLPLMDLGLYLLNQPTDPSRKLAAVLAYDGPSGVQHGGLLLAGLPRRIQLTTLQASALPDDLPKWKDLAISCFSYQQQPMPILDLPRIYAEALL